MAALPTFSVIDNFDYKIRRLELQYAELENELKILTNKLQENAESPHHLATANKISTMCKVLFLIKGNLLRALEESTKRMNSLNERVKRLESKSRKRVPKRNDLFATKAPHSSFYFRTATAICIKNNSDYVEMEKSEHLFLSYLPMSKQWRSQDQQKLHNAVRQCIVSEESKKIVENMDRVYDLIKFTTNQSSLSKLQRCVEILTAKMERLKSSNLIDLLDRYPNCDLNWARIAKSISCCQRFKAQECQAMWQLVANPKINNRRWSCENVLLLNSLVNMHRFQDWEAINAELNTGRTGFLCFSRFQHHRKPHTKVAKNWTDRENALVNEFLNKPSNRQYFYSTFIENFSDVSRRQLVSHVNYVKYARGKKKGAFSPREKFLIHFFCRRGYSYRKIARITRRSSKQIYDLYSRSKLRNVRRRWNHAEVRKLLLVKKYNGACQWPEISRFFYDRSPWSCRHKYNKLKSRHPEMIENCNRRAPDLKKIKHLLLTRNGIVSAKKSYSIEEKIESYFARHADQTVAPPKSYKYEVLTEKVLEIMKFLNFEQNLPQHKKHEVGQWLVKGDPQKSRKFQKLFKKLIADKGNLKFEKKAKFLAVRQKTCPVLPPNKCTIHGVNNFIKNLEKYCSTAGQDFQRVWNVVDTAQSQNRNFTEAKLLWYQILKAFLYWPLKLNTMPVDSFL